MFIVIYKTGGFEITFLSCRPIGLGAHNGQDKSKYTIVCLLRIE